VVRRIKPRAAARQHLRLGKLRQDPARRDSSWRLRLVTEWRRAPIQRLRALQRELETAAKIRADGAQRVQRHSPEDELHRVSPVLLLHLLLLFRGGSGTGKSAEQFDGVFRFACSLSVDRERKGILSQDGGVESRLIDEEVRDERSLCVHAACSSNSSVTRVSVAVTFRNLATYAARCASACCRTAFSDAGVGDCAASAPGASRAKARQAWSMGALADDDR
jgi:hypothetical protein